jgi:hypothetical protein
MANIPAQTLSLSRGIERTAAEWTPNFPALETEPDGPPHIGTR